MWPRSQPDEGEAVETWEFQLTPNNPPIKRIIRWLRAMALVGLAVTLGLYALGKIDWFDALLFSLFSIAIGTFWVFGFRQMGKGTVQLTRDGILVRGSGGRAQDFAWKDIAEVQVSSPSGRWAVDRLWTRVDEAGEDAPFVEVKLKRSRLPLVIDRYGTLWGIPGLGPKTLRLYVTDPEGLVKAAQPFLNQWQSTPG